MNINLLSPEVIKLRDAWFKHVFFTYIKDTSSSCYIIYNFLREPATVPSEQLTQAIDYCEKTVLFRMPLECVNTSRVTITDTDINGNMLLSFRAKDGSYNTINDIGIRECVASLCKEKEIIFDDTIHGLNGLKHTKLGQLLLDNNCFKSQATRNTTARGANDPAQTQRQTGVAAGGKPHLADCNGIVGQKDILAYMYVYWIGGEFNKAGKTQPRIHVKPLRSTLPDGTLEVFTNGSGQGFEDCVLFWTSQNAVLEVANKIDKNKHGSKVLNYQVKRQSAKGYFYTVKTEFGDAYIKADNIIESLDSTSENKCFEDFNNFLKDLN